MLHKYITAFETQQITTPPVCNVGDLVEVYLNIREGARSRTQKIRGYIIAKRKRGLGSSLHLLGVGKHANIEVKIPLYSRDLQQVTVLRSHRVRQSKLYFMRKLTGKSLRLKKSY